jgi:transketolase
MKNKITEDCKEIRRQIVKLTYLNRIGHIGTTLSMVEILYALYFFVLGPIRNPGKISSRDRFIIGSSLGKISIYAEAYGKSWLDDFLAKDFTPISSHNFPIIEMCNESLGHNLSFGVGTALYAKQHSLNFHTYVICGDGELEEGSMWEAIMSAAHFKLNNLTLIINRNYLQIDDSTESIIGLEPLQEKFLSFGWDVYCVDGHRVNEISKILTSTNKQTKPKVIIANTAKGKGISFMENSVSWHSKSPNKEELDLALQELQ